MNAKILSYIKLLQKIIMLFKVTNLKLVTLGHASTKDCKKKVQ